MSPPLMSWTATLGSRSGRTPTTSVSTWRIGCRWMSSSLSGAPSSTQLPHPRVVARQLLQPPVAQQIHAAVADVDQRGVAVLEQHGRHRGPHAGVVRRSRRRLPGCGRSRAARRLRAPPLRRTCGCGDGTGDRRDRQRRRHLAGVVPAHAVGHHEQAGAEIHQARILVGCTRPRVGDAVGLDRLRHTAKYSRARFVYSRGGHVRRPGRARALARGARARPRAGGRSAPAAALSLRHAGSRRRARGPDRDHRGLPARGRPRPGGARRSAAPRNP